MISEEQRRLNYLKATKKATIILSLISAPILVVLSTYIAINNLADSPIFWLLFVVLFSMLAIEIAVVWYNLKKFNLPTWGF